MQTVVIFMLVSSVEGEKMWLWRLKVKRGWWKCMVRPTLNEVDLPSLSRELLATFRGGFP